MLSIFRTRVFWCIGAVVIFMGISSYLLYIPGQKVKASTETADLEAKAVALCEMQEITHNPARFMLRKINERYEETVQAESQQSNPSLKSAHSSLSLKSGEMASFPSNSSQPIFSIRKTTASGSVPENPLQTLNIHQEWNTESLIDGDSITNKDECAYWGLYYADPAEQWQHYIEAGLYEPIARDCIPTVDVTIQIEGNGKVLPNETATTYTHKFAKYDRNCSLQCPLDYYYPSCGYNKVTFTAIPDDGWVLKRWSTDEEQEGKSTPTYEVEMNSDHYMIVEFVQRPGMDTLDLTSDLQYFWMHKDPAASADESIAMDVNGLDLNYITYYADRTEYSGNGIPDIAEFSLLNKVLTTIGLSLSSQHGGITHDEVWNAWQTNLTQARIDLNGLADPIIRTVAAYMTIGDYDTFTMITNKVARRFPGHNLSSTKYDHSRQQFLAAEGDADMDGLTNKEEWDAAQANIDQYIILALDSNAEKNKILEKP